MLCKPEVAADAVLDVNDRIADSELREVADHRLDVRGALALPSAQTARARCVKLGFGDDSDARLAQHEAFVQRRHTEADRCIGRDERVEVCVVRERQSILGQHLRNRFAATGRIGNDQHATAAHSQLIAAKVVDERAQPADRIFGAPLDCEQRQRLEAFVRAFSQRNARRSPSRARKKPSAFRNRSAGGMIGRVTSRDRNR